MLIDIATWILLAVGVTWAMFAYLRAVSGAGVQLLRQVADQLFGVSAWSVASGDKAFGLAISQAVKGKVGDQEVWIEYNAAQGDPGDSYQSRLNYLAAFFPIPLQSTTVIAKPFSSTSTIVPLIALEGLNEVAPSFHALGDQITVKTDSPDQRAGAIFDNASFRSAVVRLCAERWFVGLSLGTAKANTGFAAGGTIRDGKSGVLLTAQMTVKEFTSIQTGLTQRLRELAQACQSLRA
jgi:hypothetical protein